MTVAFDTLGCKLNQAETESLARQFADAGYRLVSPSDGADIYVLNTCTVTHIADRKARHLLRMARRRNPNALLVATGCYAERAREELTQIEGVDFVLDNSEKTNLLHILEESGRIAAAGNHDRSRQCRGLRTRSFLKVQDGCNCSCAYCIVPLVRSNEKSMPFDQVIAEVRQRVEDGCKEVVLTGTEVGSYEYEGAGLKELLERILAETEIERLRLSSLQPQEISPELIRLWQNDPRLCRHFHLSLQSGSDSTLRRMRRRYNTTDYQRAVSLIRSAMPETAITTDIIVGFPGETGEEFEESYNFCQKMDFARVHVFTFSPRPGTEAAGMPDHVRPQVKKERSEKMLALAEECVRIFSNQFLGTNVQVLWERQTGGLWSGLTGNYIKVYARSSEDLTNRLLPAKLVEVRRDGVRGEIG
ncbi:MAG: tRNA (N(6)-L-threonylcarbamoyladenosine(37)-C(2))-methylthiotransferase MtaB [Chloroflexi bacterium]|nr:tRNA (N(6)-L-threonylcarbamoyladenosine(37)-C(2))-methylthiotransferase MtaB [Chloroflexota bacterium]